MGAAGIAAMTLSRPSSRWYALLLAAAVTLALNPRACGDPGWQLSFVAVAGILVAGRPLAATAAADRGGAGGAAARRERRAAAGAGVAPSSTVSARAIAITVAATLATAPLLAYHFGSVPLAGLPANLLALPAVAPAMWLGMVKASLGLAAPLLPGADRLAEALGPLTRVPIAYLDGLAERCATLPGGRLKLPLNSRACGGVGVRRDDRAAFGARLARRRGCAERAATAAGAASGRRADAALASRGLLRLSSRPRGVGVLARFALGLLALVAVVLGLARGRRARHPGAAGRAHRPLPRHRPG